jgi:hypothetical protein
MFNRRKLAALAAAQTSRPKAETPAANEFSPFKPGTRQLKKGYRYTSNGNILEAATGKEYQKPE